MEPPNVATPEQVGIQSKKIIVGHEQGDSPDLSPLFVNNIEVLQVGSDFFLDAGIIRPDEIAQAGIEVQNGARTSPVKLDFFVLQRIAMSEHTFRMLMNRGRAFLEGLDQTRQEASEPK